jgi:hypothetical protein
VPGLLLVDGDGVAVPVDLPERAVTSTSIVSRGPSPAARTVS